MNTTYHVCKYTPTELLAAFGGRCALLDEAPEAFDLSDQVATPTCAALASRSSRR